MKDRIAHQRIELIQNDKIFRVVRRFVEAEPGPTIGSLRIVMGGRLEHGVTGRGRRIASPIDDVAQHV